MYIRLIIKIRIPHFGKLIILITCFWCILCHFIKNRKSKTILKSSLNSHVYWDTLHSVHELFNISVNKQENGGERFTIQVYFYSAYHSRIILYSPDYYCIPLSVNVVNQPFPIATIHSLSSIVNDRQKLT